MFVKMSIKNEDDHRTAIEETESLFTAAPGSPEFTRLHYLVDMIEAYEQTVFTVPPPSDEAVRRFAYCADLLARELVVA